MAWSGGFRLLEAQICEMMFEFEALELELVPALVAFWVDP